jgi:hypothetical protein
LRDAIAERPVLPLDLDEADKDILPTEAERPGEPVGDRLVERLLLVERAASFR